MFSIVPNPFTGNSKREKEMQRAMDQHARDRDTREQTNRAAWESRARADQAQRGLKTAGAGIGGNKASLAQRSKYQMEPDSDDDAAEDEIENNLGTFSNMCLRNLLQEDKLTRTFLLQINYTLPPRA